MASTLRSYANSTMRERGLGIAILGVDIALLGVDVAVLGVDIAIFGVDIANLRRRGKKGGATGGGRRGREEGEVNRVRRLEAGWIARESGGTKSHKGRRAPSYKPILGVRSGRGLGCRGTVRRSV